MCYLSPARTDAPVAEKKRGRSIVLCYFCIPALLFPSRFTFLYPLRDSALIPFPICVNLRASAVKIIGFSGTPVSINNPAIYRLPKCTLDRPCPTPPA
jgi:hypothetical protein